MLRNFKERRNNKNKEYAYRHNGVYQLNSELREKWFRFDSALSGGHYSKYFTWNEFCEIINKTTFVYKFRYKNKEYSILNEINRCTFYNEESNLLFTFKNTTELINNIKINNCVLKNIYQEFIFIE